MKRILTALILLPFIVWVVLFAPFWVFAAVLVAVGLIAFYEFDHMAEGQGIPRAGLPGMAAGLAILFAPQPLAMIILVALLAMGLALRVRDLASALPAAAAFLLGDLYIFGAWRCAAGLRALNPNWLMIALLVSWAGDTAALYIGRAFGRHKAAPRVSPGKTWEGCIASVAGAVIAAAIYAHYLIPAVGIWIVVAVAAAANIAGQVGDLCESAFKRGAGLKDSGTTLPGHGGWLDRIDSSLFSIPVVFAILTYLPAIMSHVHV